MECLFCKKEFKNSKHIYNCEKRGNTSKKEIKFYSICHESNFNFSKNYIYKKYIKEEWSLPDFKRKHGLSYRQTYFLLDYFNIKKRDIYESNSLKSRFQKYKKTCNKKYGVNNVSQLKEVKEKKKKTFLNNYGVDNIFKDKEFKKNLNFLMLDKYGKLRINNPEKIKDYYKNLNENEKTKISEKNSIRSKLFWDNITEKEKAKWVKKKSDSAKRYWESVSEDFKKEIGKKFSIMVKKWWNNLSDEEKNRIVKNNIKKLSNNFVSKLETRINNILFKWKLEYTSQYRLGFYSFDFLIGKNIILEVQGDFWHANPLLYKECDILPFPIKSKSAKQIWLKDRNKKAYAEKRGFKIIYIWESEMKKIKDCELEKLLETKIMEKNDE